MEDDSRRAEQEKLLNVRDVARLLGYTERRIRDWLNRGVIYGFRLKGTRKWQIPRDVIDRYLGATRAEEQQASDRANGNVSARQYMAMKVQNYRASYLLLNPKELAQIYLERRTIVAASQPDKEFLLHCWLAGLGPAWYWLREIEKSDYLSMLISALDEPLPAVRSGAAKAVGSIGTKEHLPRLLTLLVDDDYQTSLAATDAIVQLCGVQDPRYLIELLVGGSYGNLDMDSFSEAVADSATQNELPQLRNMLRHRDNRFAQWAAVKALGRLGNSSDLCELFVILKNYDLEDDNTLAYTIGTLGKWEDVQILTGIAADAVSGPVFDVAWKAIGIIAVREGHQYLRDIFQNGASVPRQLAQGVSLGVLKATEGLSLLKELWSILQTENDRDRHYGLEAWLIIGICEVATLAELPLLREHLLEPFTRKQMAVIKALGRLGSRDEDLPLLIELVEQHVNRESVADAATKVIGRLATAEDIPRLERTLARVEMRFEGPTEPLAAAMAGAGTEEDLDRLAKTAALGVVPHKGVLRALTLLDEKIFCPFHS